MPLIVMKRKEKGLAKGCFDCDHFGELKDDPKQYPSTVAVVCNAPQTDFMNCFEYMWLMVKGRYHETPYKPKRERKPVIPAKPEEFNTILNRLRKIGKKKPLRL